MLPTFLPTNHGEEKLLQSCRVLCLAYLCFGLLEVALIYLPQEI